jgi:hypothetical protein
MWKQKPNPRIVSNIVGHIENVITPNKAGVNMLFAQWGQLVDHDITLVPSGNIEN